MDVFKLAEQEREYLRLLHYPYKRESGCLVQFATNQFLTAHEMCAGNAWTQRHIFKIPYGKFALYSAGGYQSAIRAVKIITVLPSPGHFIY